MTVTPTFVVIPSTFSAMLVKGISSGPQLPLASGTSTTITSTNNFTNCVSILKPMTIDWQVSIDNGTNWHDIATTANKVYVTLNNPASGLTLYHTVVHLACVNAVGQTTVGGTVDAVFSGFTGLIVKRVSDNIQMTYWYNNLMGATETGGDIKCDRRKR